jgi:hypothetical protein
MTRRLSWRILLTVSVAFVFFPVGVFAGTTLCPRSPPPNSKVTGGLEVDGTCILDHVTVVGGIVVEATGGLEIENVTVNGGIIVDGGELDVGALLANGTPTGHPNTINDGVRINGATDLDIRGARIDGGVTITGKVGSEPGLCGNDVRGGVTLTNATATFQILVGDPEEFACPGNAIHGSLSVSDSSAPSGVELEHNTVSGSVLIDGGFVEVGHNNIGGSLLCSPGTVLRTSADSGGNTVRGSNTCE